MRLHRRTSDEQLGSETRGAAVGTTGHQWIYAVSRSENVTVA